MVNLSHDQITFEQFDNVAEEFKQWLIMDTWKTDSAMWLLSGVIPSKVYEQFGFFTTDLKLLSSTDVEEKIHKISNLKRLWLSNPSLPERANPLIYLAWAEKKNIHRTYAN